MAISRADTFTALHELESFFTIIHVIGNTEKTGEHSYTSY